MEGNRHQVFWHAMAWMAAFALVAWSPRDAKAQSVDIHRTHLTIGRAVDLQLRVRIDGGQASPVAPHCIHVEIVADDQLLPRDELSLTTQPDPRADWTRVHVQHPHVVRSASVQARLQLHCGPSYERVFEVPTQFAAAQPKLNEPGNRHSRTRFAHHPAAVTPGLTATETTSTAAHDTTTPSGERPDVATTAPLPRPASLSVDLTDKNRHSGAPTTTGPGEHETTPADFKQLLEAQQRLHDEHQRVLTQMNALKAQLAHDNLSPAPLSWVVIAALMSLCLVALTRLNTTRYALPRPAARTASGGFPHSAALAPTPRQIPVVNPAPPSVQEPPLELTIGDADIEPREPRPAAQLPGSPWPDANFGTASFDDVGVEELLSEVAHLTQQGFPAAAAVTLEQQLMRQEGKHPRLLLALLDVYCAMDQSWNHDRVAAQMEALYNVRVSPMADASLGTSSSEALEQYPVALERIIRTWRGREATGAIASVLLASEVLTPLSLAAFRDVAWLHAIARNLSHHPDEDFSELTLTPLNGSQS